MATAGHHLGEESGGHGGRDDVMPAVMPASDEKELSGVNGVGLASGRREANPAGVTNGHDDFTPEVNWIVMEF